MSDLCLLCLAPVPLVLRLSWLIMSISARLQRLLSAPALSLLASAFLIVSLAGSNKITPIATLPDGAPLQLFHPKIGAADDSDRQRTAAMFILLGAVTAFSPSADAPSADARSCRSLDADWPSLGHGAAHHRADASGSHCAARWSVQNDGSS